MGLRKPLECRPPFGSTPNPATGIAFSGFMSRMLGGAHLDPRAFTATRAPLQRGASVQVLPGMSANSLAQVAAGNRYKSAPVSRGVQRRGG